MIGILFTNRRNDYSHPPGTVIHIVGTIIHFDRNPQIGSLTPYWSSYFSISYYEFSDGSGATYRLNQNNNGIWTSTETVYVTYDSNAQRLYFNSGTFWVLGCISAGTEPDAGSMYPTLVEDSNGNQISIGYAPGNGVSWDNSSARIVSIQDVRGGSNPSSPTYSFTYNSDPVPHLTGITNTINSQESFVLSYTSASALVAPFSSSNASSFGQSQFLSSVQNNAVSLTTTMTYDSVGAGELTEVNLPYGGYIRWQYRTASYLDSGIREIASRYLLWDSSIGERAYLFSAANASGANVPASRTLTDSQAGAVKTWTFNQSQNATQGLATSYAEGTSSTTLRQTNYTWAQDPVGNNYISRLQVINDPSTSNQVTKQTDQTVDQYGNVIQTKLYDYTDLTNASKIYNSTYLTSANGTNYTALYIRNRLLTSTLTDKNNNTTTLVTNTYDQYGNGIASTSNITQQDTEDYGPGYTTRGNLYDQMTPAGGTHYQYDQTGTAIWMGNDANSNEYVGYTNDSSTNYAAPTILTTANSLQTAMTWSSFLGLTSQTGPNSDQSTTSYDNGGRVQAVTSPYGGGTTYSYGTNGTPYTVTATTDNRIDTTYLDGLGRPYRKESGDNTGVQSVVETVYDSCGCTPLGKPWKRSMPHAPGATPVWKSFTYDTLGRTLTQVAPDGASTTTYSYAGNVVTVTDPAGKWKQYTTDAFGRLISVVEPSPNPATEPNHVTLYTYDVFDHLTQAQMSRTINNQVVTQYRTWTYDPTTLRLTSQTAPESGTTSYTYNADSTLATVTDSNNHRNVYTYDTYGRVTQIARGTVTNGNFVEDTTQRTTLTYDGTNGGFSSNTSGRVSLVTYSGPHGLQFKEMYSYHSAGAVTGKKLQVSGTALGSKTANLEADYTYDGLGRVLSVQYPFAAWSNGTTTSGGPQYTYGYDTMGRLSNMQAPGNTYLVNNVTYGPASEMLQMTAPAFTETRTYNANLQLTELVSGTSLHYQYTYSATQNNGRIQSQVDVISGETITYAYDSLNRLIQASATGDPTGSWSEAFTYDGFGNLTQKNGSNAPNNLYLGADPLTNRLNTNGAQYDNNGNLTNWGTGISAAVYTYDLENRLSTSVTSGGPQIQFGYDSGNQRVYQGTYNTSTSTYSNEKLYFYGADGKKLVVYSLTSGSSPKLTASQTNQWFGGRLLKPQDRLSSIGKYFPYGEDRYNPTPANPANDQEKFATYTRDSATGLDYAYQRYYDSFMGRFHTSDPYVANGGGAGDPAQPQSWNRYAYTESDPVNAFDPAGTCTDSVTAGGTTTSEYFDCSDVNPSAIYENLSYPGQHGVAIPATASFLSNPKAVAAAVSATSARISAAVKVALQALSNRKCAGLFSLDPKAPDPATLLSKIASGNDPQAYFTEEFIAPQSPNIIANAITQPTPYSLRNGQLTHTNVANNVVVAFNYYPTAPFNTGSVTSDAITVLHELGHVYEFLYGLGSTYLVNDSVQAQGGVAQSNAASAYNTLLVQTNCFPGAH